MRLKSGRSEKQPPAIGALVLAVSGLTRSQSADATRRASGAKRSSRGSPQSLSASEHAPKCSLSAIQACPLDKYLCSAYVVGCSA